MTTALQSISAQFKQFSRNLRTPIDMRHASRRLADFHRKERNIEEVVDFALAFGGRGHFRVRTTQIREEILALARRVADLQPRAIVEIGTAWGGTLLIWAHIASELAISCDINDTSRQADLYKAFPPPSSRCRVVLLTGDSHTDAFRERLADKLAGRKADFLFIDGDHTETGVAADFHDYAELARPGGLIAFHDIAEDQPVASNQVQYFWRRIRDVYQTEEIIADRAQCGYGIGLVHWSGQFRR